MPRKTCHICSKSILGGQNVAMICCGRVMHNHCRSEWNRTHIAKWVAKINRFRNINDRTLASIIRMCFFFSGLPVLCSFCGMNNTRYILLFMTDFDDIGEPVEQQKTSSGSFEVTDEPWTLLTTITNRINNNNWSYFYNKDMHIKW